jgi:hypothetical protein
MGQTDSVRAARGIAAVPRFALTKAETARALGVSTDFFDDHVAHELRCVRRGRHRLYSVAEISRWLEASADKASDGRMSA